MTRLSDEELGELRQRFPTHLGEPEASVLVQRAVSELLVLRHLVKRIDETLRVPAAEYVPAISDVFTLIDALAADSAAKAG